MEIREFRARSRIPVLCWSQPTNNVSLFRSAQPLVGMFTNKSAADQKLIRLIREAYLNGWMYIIDARPMVNAYGNHIKGAGVETGYDNVDVLFMSIENVHQVSDSWKQLCCAVILQT